MRNFDGLSYFGEVTNNCVFPIIFLPQKPLLFILTAVFDEIQKTLWRKPKGFDVNLIKMNIHLK